MDNEEIVILKQRLETAGKEIVRTGNENLDLKDKVKELTTELSAVKAENAELKKKLTIFESIPEVTSAKLVADETLASEKTIEQFQTGIDSVVASVSDIDTETVEDPEAALKDIDDQVNAMLS